MVSRSIFANKSRFPNESGFLNESRFNESLPNKSRFKSRYSELIPNESRFSFSKVSRFPNVSRFQRDFQNETRSEKDSLFETSLVFPNVSQTCLLFWASHVFMAYRVPIISRRFLSSPISLVYQKPWEIPIEKHVSLLSVKIFRLQRGLTDNPLQHNFLFIVMPLEAIDNIKRSRTSHARVEKM